MSRTLNRDPKYMSGKYAKMFDIEPIASNKNFALNQYKPGKCECSNMVCFSLVNGAMACRPDNTKMLAYNADGVLVSKPLNHQGPIYI